MSCHGGMEGQKHLFFDCSFANLVWLAVKSWCDWGQVSRTSEAVLQWGIIHLWREQNFWIFQQKGRDHEAVRKRVMEEVNFCISSWKNLPRSATNLILCSNWGIPTRVLKQA